LLVLETLLGYKTQRHTKNVAISLSSVEGDWVSIRKPNEAY